ncbi:MAG: hypothetical protein GTO22_21610, partial [Gemmatimonadales bacterium]|nr:hypothetical protein [Gemmatimonadales bacterium]
TATGSSVSAVGFLLAGSGADEIEVTILEDNGQQDVRDWTVLGSRTRHITTGDQWVRWRSGEILTTPGKQYGVRLKSTDASNFQVYRRNKDSNSYVGGQAHNSNGTAQNFDLNVTVSADNDGTIITMNKRTPGLGSLQSANYGQRWAQTFTAKGKALAGVDLWAAGANNYWDLDFEWKVHQGGPGGTQIGPTKITKAGYQSSGIGLHAVSYNLSEVPLTAEQTYCIEVTIYDPPPESNGYNPFVMVAADEDDDTYTGGIAYKY